MAPFSAFVTIVLLILSRQVFTYIPSHVQVWQPGIIYAGTNPTSFYWGYDKFTAAPQNVFLKLGGFYPVTQNMLDIRLEVALYSTYIRIDVFKGPIMDFSQVEFGILMTNDGSVYYWCNF